MEYRTEKEVTITLTVGLDELEFLNNAVQLYNSQIPSESSNTHITNTLFNALAEAHR